MNRRDRVMRAQQIAAHYTARGGAGFLPVFERMEGEISAMATAESALDRARRLAGL